ncbi:MAG: DUF1801 domain-containing protein [Actinomycetota bacterium]|nr:DUF1801 domain-containing protein [Geodermatophilaceae bacterium]MDQ3504878.1 DUF1801 domain-containing protein [Actinomycetota bacterium]
MDKAAGIINSTGRADDRVFREAISAGSADVQGLALAVRDLVFDLVPETVEVVWPKQRSVGWGIGPKKFTEQFAYLMPFKAHVTLGFYHGGELPDPDGLLPQSGGKQVSGSLSMRSLRLQDLDKVGQPALRSLIVAAAGHQVSIAPGGEAGVALPDVRWMPDL